MSRDLGSSMTPRGVGTSLSPRDPTISLSNRTTESGADPRTEGQSLSPRIVQAVPATGVVVQYVDRYVYVDGSMVTATVFEMSFAYGDATPRAIFSLAAGAVIAEVNVWLLEAFDGVGAKINIGRNADPDELLNDSEIDPAFLSSYSTRPGAKYGIGEIVSLSITPGAGASHGRGVLSIYII